MRQKEACFVCIPFKICLLRRIGFFKILPRNLSSTKKNTNMRPREENDRLASLEVFKLKRNRGDFAKQSFPTCEYFRRGEQREPHSVGRPPPDLPGRARQGIATFPPKSVEGRRTTGCDSDERTPDAVASSFDQLQRRKMVDYSK
jgi:hypothetical protein